MASRRRHFSFTLFSATDLPDVREFGRMKVYAKVSLRNVANTEYQTSVDEVNGTNPKWNTRFSYMLSQSCFKVDPGLVLDVELYCRRTFADDKYVGQVNINLKRLFESSLSNPCSMSVKVGDFTTTQGTIDFSYNFGDLESADGEVVEDNKSFVEVLAVQTMISLIVEGIKTVVLAALS